MKRPLLWPLSGFIAGILSLPDFSFSPSLFFLLLALVLAGLFISLLRRSKLGLLFSITLGFALLGHSLAAERLEAIGKSQLVSQQEGEEGTYFIGRVESSCEEGEEGASFVVEVKALRRSGEMEGSQAQGKVLLRIKEGDCAFEAGDVVQTFAKLKTPRRFQNDGSFDYPFFLKTRGVTATAFVENSQGVVKIGEERGPLESAFAQAKNRIKAALAPLPEEERRILWALLLGEKRNLSEKTQDLFRRTGTTHLLVVSGLHLVMVGAVFYLLFRLCFSLRPSWLNKISVGRWAGAFSLLPVALYAALVGFSPSVLRAILMASFGLVLILFPRERDGLGLLALTAFLLLLWEPLYAFDLSFQLSFLSIFFILLFVPPLERAISERWKTALKPWLKPFLQAALASLAVQVGLFPLLASRFHQVSLVSLPANLVLVPFFTFLLMPLGLLGMGLAPFSPSLSTHIFSGCAQILRPAEAFLQFLADLPGSAPHWAGFSALQTLFFYGFLAVFLLPWARRRKIALASLLLLLNGAAWVWRPLADRLDQSIVLNFLDVGQGDAMFLRLPHGKKMLVDGGGFANSSFDLGERVLLPYLFSKRVGRLDAIVLTHPHPDHYGGLLAVVKAFSPREFWWNGEKSESADFIRLMEEIRRQNIPLKKMNSSVPPFFIEGVRFEVLYPNQDIFVPENPDSSTVNNHSLVLRLSRGDFSILLSGDVEKESEQVLLEGGKLRPIFVLKIPHHGSDTSSSEDWVSVLQPKLGLIGVGRDNPFRFPREAVLARYEKLGTEIYRTDRDGEIELRWNGSNLRVESFTGRKSFLHPNSPSPGASSPRGPYGESSSGF